MRLRYTERARNDIEFAFEWYEKQRGGLGFDFLDRIELALKDLLIFPECINHVIQINFLSLARLAKPGSPEQGSSNADPSEEQKRR